MDTGNIIRTIIGVVVAVVIVTTVMTPIVSDVSLDDTEIINEPSESTASRLSHLDGNHTITIPDANTYTVDGVEYTMPKADGFRNYFVITDTVYMYAMDNTPLPKINLIIGIQASGSQTYTSVSANMTSSMSEVTISLKDGVAEIVLDGETYSVEYNDGFYIDPDGEFSNYLLNSTVRCPHGSTIYGYTYNNDMMLMLQLRDGEVVEGNFVNYGTTPPEAVTEFNLNSEAIYSTDGTIDTYVYGACTLNEDITLNLLYIAPVEYSSTTFPGVEQAISIIPLIVVVGIIVAAIGAFLYYRR